MHLAFLFLLAFTAVFEPGLDPDRLTLEADIVAIGGINRYAPFVNATDVFLPEIYPVYGKSPKGDKVLTVDPEAPSIAARRTARSSS